MKTQQKMKSHSQEKSPDVVFFDVETPNCKNDSICSIGILRTTCRGKVLSYAYHLIDPESPFDQRNVDVHGIRPYNVAGSPTFSQIWDEELETLFSEANLVAHNALFDLSVLRKSLARYDKKLSSCGYTCTLRESKSLIPEAPSYNLRELCDFLDLPLEKHHHAMADANACRYLFAYLCRERGLDPFECWQDYDFTLKTTCKKQNTSCS